MIGVIDYSLGNINALLNIYKQLNVPCTLVSREEDFEHIDKIVLPGVGAFDHAMTALEDSGLLERLNHFVLCEKKPVLGICVGMQMMANSSEEGEKNGLGWISGVVKKIQVNSCFQYPLPHMGWNAVYQVRESKLFENIYDNSEFYFLHSYFFEACDKQSIIAQSVYPRSFPVVVSKNNIYGIQCHPEKSHFQGVQLLKNFAEL